MSRELLDTSVLFVCLGNICRSPLAQGAFEQQLRRRGLADRFRTDSCGTAAFNLGKPPDPRAIAAAQSAGFDISQQRARQIQDEDYQRFTHIVAMDRNNLSNVQAWAPSTYSGVMQLLMDYVPQRQHAQVADPYYAAAGEFDHVLAEISIATGHLLEHLLAGAG